MISLKLPKEVLDLFPMWEYRCRNCGTIYGEPKQVCIKCGTPIDLIKDRIPPRFMKNHKAMSNYAHKILAPKLSPEQRNLLFKYFTELFSDGFESGDFSAWTATSNVSIVESPVHHGDYACKGTSGGNHYVQKDLASSYPILYTRWYMRFETTPDVYHDLFTYQTTGASVLFRFGAWNSGGDHRWYVNITGTQDIYSETISASQWYCFECLYDVTNDSHKFWRDGDLLITINKAVATEAQRIVIGIHNAGDWPPETYIDCVVVADTYVGPEAAAQTYTKTWTTDALFKKLGIPKTLSVDTAFQKQDIPKAFGLDATFQKSFIIQKQIDALFKRFDILKSFAVDARFGALMTQTISRQIDVLLKKLDLTKNFGLDVYFGPVEAETYAKTFALDAIFAYKVRLPELWLDENGKIVLNISKPYTWVGS